MYKLLLLLVPVVFCISWTKIDYHNHGVEFESQNRTTEAIAAYCGALPFPPSATNLAVVCYAFILFNSMGQIMVNLGDFASAERFYLQALQSDSSYYLAVFGFASLCYRNGHRLQALGLFFRAEILASTPRELCNVYTNIAVCYLDLHNSEKALEYADKALALDETQAYAHNARALALRQVNLHLEAIDAGLLAIQSNTQCFECAMTLAHLYYGVRDIPNAYAAVQHALTVRPESTSAFPFLVYMSHFLCDWTNYDQNMDKVVQLATSELNSGRPSDLQIVQAMVYPVSPVLLLSLAAAQSKYTSETTQRAIVNLPAVPSPPSRHRESRIRLGYLTSTFSRHVVAYTMYSVIGAHSRERFNVTGYATSPDDGSGFRAYAKNSMEQFVDISGQDLLAATTQLRNDELDVLFSLDGWTEGSRNDILATQSVPVQIQVQGFSSTVAAPFIHYLLSDRVASPPEFSVYYGEKLIFMRGTYFASSYRDLFGDKRPTAVEKAEIRKQIGVSDQTFLYCNFNQLYKIIPSTFRSWMRILQMVPDSALWLLQYPEAGVQNLLLEAAQHGIDPTRLKFTPLAPWTDHIQWKSVCDVSLDTHPYGAHGTAMDTRVPLVTLAGKTMASRIASSIYASAGLSELSCATTLQYEALAVDMSRNPLLLQAYKQKAELARSKVGSPFDTSTEYTISYVCLISVGAWIRQAERAAELAVTLRTNNVRSQHIIIAV